jgi:hypothetical protein
MSDQKPCYQKPPVTPTGRAKIESRRRNHDELERAVRDAIDPQTGRK